MLDRFWCWLLGHKPLKLHALTPPDAVELTQTADVITVHDTLGEPLVVIRMCERCGLVYWERW